MTPAGLFDSASYAFNPHALPLFISIAFIAALAGKAVTSKKSKTAVYFATFCSAIIVWLFFTALGYLVKDNAALAAFWFQLDWMGVSYISINVYAFAVYFVGRENPIAIRVGYGLATMFAVLTLTLNPMMRGVQKFWWGFFPLHEYRWSPVFFVFFFGYMVWAFAELIFAYRRTSEAVRRNQIKYMFAALVIAYLGSVDFLPTYGFAVYPIGFAAILAFVAITAYAILRHHLMDINVVIRKTLLYSMASTGLVAIYAGMATLLARILEDHSVSSLSQTLNLFHGLTTNIHFYRIGYAAGCASTAIMGMFVFLAKPRKPEARLWALLSILVSIWFFGRLMMLNCVTPDQAYFWERILYLGAIPLNIVYFHFVLAFTKEGGWRKMLWAGYATAAFLLIVNGTTHLFISKVTEGTIFPFYEHHGLLYPIHFIVYLIYPGTGIYLLWRNHMRDSPMKNQTDYVLFATGIGFLCGATTFPLIFGIKFPPVGAPFTTIYAFIIAYAIIAHQLMDITVIIRKTLLYSVVSAALAAIYVGIITLAAHFLGERRGTTTAFSSALAAIFITLFFNPLRLRTQRWIDRHFPREHLDPELLQEAAGGFAHEMKRPLSKISLPAELALIDLERVQSGELNWQDALPKFKERLKFIMNQSVEAGYMIEAIRELSTSSTSPLLPVDLCEPLKSAIQAQQELLQRHQITLHVRVRDNIPKVSGRRRQLEIVFVNLIKNAAEAMSILAVGRKRELHIDDEAADKRVVLRINDTGPGIRPEDQRRLFLPNYTTKGSHGVGIGLYLSLQIIESHGGLIEVHPGLYGGAQFSVILPILGPAC